MRIYTRTGDRGTTSLIGGKRVGKDCQRIEAYGTIDELNANIGMLQNYDFGEENNSLLHNVQNRLFAIGSFLACADAKSCEDLQAKVRPIDAKDINNLELAIDKLQAILPELKNFVLPVGSPAASWCNITRTVCRRAERRIVCLKENDYVDEYILLYINRLSDYLFVLGRYVLVVNKIKEKVCDLNL